MERERLKSLVVKRVASASLLLLAVLGTKAGPTELWGFLRSSTDGSSVGVYSFDAGQGMTLKAVNTAAFSDPYSGDVDANGGGVFYGGKFYFIELFEFFGDYYPMYYSYDINTWKPDALGSEMDNLDLVANAVTYDASTGLCYGIFLNNNGNDWVLGAADYAKKTRTKIADTDTLYSAFAADKQGRVFAISEGNNLYEMNKTTGAMTLVGPTGVKADAASYLQSATISQRTGEMFWSAVTKGGRSALYSVNTSTGAATKISDFPNNAQLVCLYVPNEEGVDGAPVKVGAVTANFPEGALAGSIDFRLPAVDNAGNALSGALDYFVVENGDTLLRGTGNAGDSISAPLVTTTGEHSFVVTVANDKGGSPASTVTAYVGFDTPKAPKNVKLSITRKGLATLTWDAVDEGVNGGYVGDITYDVIRYPDSVRVTTTDTCLQEQFADEILHSYMYGVSATSHGLTSRQTKSNGASVGAYYETPWHDGFDTQADFDLWNIVDRNDDGYTWSYFDGISSNSYAQTSWSYLRGADDWLISPPVYLGVGTYTVSFKAKSTLSSSPERIEVLYGRGSAAASMTDSLFRPVVLDNPDAFNTYTTTMTTVEDGIYHLGFHAISDAGMCRIQLDDVSVVESTPTAIGNASGRLPDAPDVVYDLSGRRIATMQRGGHPGLRPGVYVVRGRKVVVR